MKLKFEKVSDVNATYCHLDVFHEDEKAPFLEIHISDEKNRFFTLFPSQKTIILSQIEWDEILHRSINLLSMEIKNEESFRRMTSDQEELGKVVKIDKGLPSTPSANPAASDLILSKSP